MFGLGLPENCVDDNFLLVFIDLKLSFLLVKTCLVFLLTVAEQQGS